MASQSIVLKANGLRLTGNTLAEDGSGSLEKADNVICRQDGIAETRKGQALDTNTFGDNSAEVILTMAYFKNKIIGFGAILAGNGGRFFYRASTAGAWTQIPSIGGYSDILRYYVYLDDESTRDFRVINRFVEANSNLYTQALSDDRWLLKLEAPTRTFSNAGVPEGTQIDVSIAGQTNGFIGGNCQVAYRYLLGHRDSNNNVIYGEPSGRTIVTSATVTAPVGGIIRPASGTTVRVTPTGGHTFVVGDYVALDAQELTRGETAFTTTGSPFAVTAISGTTYFEYVDTDTTIDVNAASHKYSRSYDLTVNCRLPLEGAQTDVVRSRGDWFLQVYRSRQSLSESIVPDDDMALVFETPVSTKFATTTTLQRAANVVTVTTSAAHGFAVGDRVAMVHEVPNAGYTISDGVPVQVATVPTTTTFTYADTGSNFGPSSTSQTVWYMGPTISTFQRNAGTTLTITTVAAHGLLVGQYVSWAITSGTFTAGTYLIVTVPSTTTITVTQGSGAAGPTASTQTLYPESISFTDNVPDSLRQAALYTSPQQEGILQENGRPPAMRDITLFRECLFGASPAYQHDATFTLMGTTAVGAGSAPLNSLRVDDTVQFSSGGYTYTAKSAEDLNASQFKLYTASSSPSQNIADTVASLCRCVNYRDPGLVARLISGPDDAPGTFYIRSSIDRVITYTLSRPLAWIVGDRSAAEGGSNQAQILNGVAFSKQRQPEAFPRSNLLRIGKKKARVLRNIAARDSVFVFKEDGLYRIFGTERPFSVQPIDTELVLLHPESAQAVNDKVFALSTRGVVECSESGVRVISGDLGDIQRLALIDASHPVHSCVVESEHIYMLYMTTYDSALTTSSTTTGYYIFDYVSRKWSHWPIARSCAIAPYVASLVKDQLYLGSSTVNKIWDQRRTGTSADYTDETVAVTIASSASTTSVTLSSATGVLAGDVLFQGSQYAVIESVSSNTLTLHSATYSAWSAAAATVYKKIAVDLVWNVNAGGAPGISKQLAEAFVAMRDTSFTAGKMQFWGSDDRTLTTTDVVGPQAATTISSSAETSTTDWVVRSDVPQDEATGRTFKVGINGLNAFSWSRILGTVLTFITGSERVAK